MQVMQVCVVCGMAYGCVIKRNGIIEVRNCDKCSGCEDGMWDLQYCICPKCEEEKCKL